MKALQYLYDNHRLLHKDLIVVFNDAAGCYDRIRPNQAELCRRRLGGNVNVLRTRTKIQNNMKHYVRTSVGVSKSYIEWGETEEDEEITTRKEDDVTIINGNLGGEGQGGGASPIMWLVVLIVMINTFNVFTQGAVVTDPLTMKELAISVLSYVDDNSIVKSLESNIPVEESFKIMAKDMSIWQRILQTTGGDLAVHKCTVSIMKWKWGEATGVPQLTTKNDESGTIEIDVMQNGNATTIALKRLEVWESEKQLGILLPIDGSFKQEYERRLKMSEDLGKKMYSAPLNAYESVLMYRLYYCPKISFPLSITQFTRTECNKIRFRANFTDMHYLRWA